MKSQEHIVRHPANRRGYIGHLVEGIGSRRPPADEMGCRGRPADVVSSKCTQLTRWVAGGIRPTRWVIGGIWTTRWVIGGIWTMRWVVGGVCRTSWNKHQDPKVVREKVKGGSMPNGCGEIQDEI